jgi:hypothetical protein
MLTVHKPFGLASVLAAVLASSRVSPQIVVPLKLNPPATFAPSGSARSNGR